MTGGDVCKAPSGLSSASPPLRGESKRPSPSAVTSLARLADRSAVQPMLPRK